MKMKYIIALLAASLAACSTSPSVTRLAQRQAFTDIVTNMSGAGQEIEVTFYGGPSVITSYSIHYTKLYEAATHLPAALEPYLNMPVATDLGTNNDWR